MTFAEEFTQKFKIQCATKVESTGKHCPNMPHHEIEETKDILCKDCYVTYLHKKKHDEMEARKRKCNHHPFDRDVNDDGVIQCLNCGSSLYSGLGWI